MLSGYKTYISAGLAVLGAIAGYLTGDATLAEAAQLGFTAIMAATIRSGVKTEVEKNA